MEIFSKSNSSSWLDALEVEAKGLELLREWTEDLQIQIPNVIAVTPSNLQIQSISSLSCRPEQSYMLGENLARLHGKIGTFYGLEYDNMIGLNRQYNVVAKSWGEFFLNYRLKKQIEMIVDGPLKAHFEGELQSIEKSVINFLDQSTEHPSLLHGDLWSGNYLCSENQVWLIDPAVYFGDRAADIAMTHMFGGFSREFYQGYEAVLPLDETYSVKEAIYNFYHYLNHFNLFGGSYLSACQLCLKKIVTTFR